jgi:hypothetical protein
MSTGVRVVVAVRHIGVAIYVRDIAVTIRMARISMRIGMATVRVLITMGRVAMVTSADATHYAKYHPAMPNLGYYHDIARHRVIC